MTDNKLIRDAQRYQWLRTHHLQTGPDSWIRTGDDLDEAIDAAMAEEFAQSDDVVIEPGTNAARLTDGMRERKKP